MSWFNRAALSFAAISSIDFNVIERKAIVEIFSLALYVVIKWVAYVAWCVVGLRLLNPERSRSLQYATVIGTGRLLLGILLGIFIFSAALTMNNATRNAPLTYFSIYVPVRVLEWGLFYFLISRKVTWPRSAVWVLGGVVVSCLADIPIGIMEGGVVPVGRPFCLNI